MKVKTNHKPFYGLSVHFSDGVIARFDEQGVAEMASEQEVQVVLNGDLTSHIWTDADINAADTSTSADSVVVATPQDFNSFTYQELVGIAREAQLPEAEWSKLNSKKALVEYLHNKIGGSVTN